MKGQRILSAQAPTGTFNVSAEFFGPSDRVLIVDDFLASGQTAKALQQICTEAGVQIAGFAFLALNKTQLEKKPLDLARSWCLQRRAAGTFDVPLDLSEAHQLRIRADDLLCLRWPLDGSDRSREQLIEEAFRALGGQERLGCVELRKLAKFTGFDGSDEDWSLEFASLCRDFGADEEGLGLDAFARLVDERSEQGCYCSDTELQELSQLYSVHPGLRETWVAHALVESAEKFGDILQVKFQICEVPGLELHFPRALCSTEPVPGVNLMWGLTVLAPVLAAGATPTFDVDLTSLTKPPLWEPTFEEYFPGREKNEMGLGSPVVLTSPTREELLRRCRSCEEWTTP
eukprot:g22498.t1